MVSLGRCVGLWKRGDTLGTLRGLMSRRHTCSSHAKFGTPSMNASLAMDEVAGHLFWTDCRSMGRMSHETLPIGTMPRSINAFWIFFLELHETQKVPSATSRKGARVGRGARLPCMLALFVEEEVAGPWSRRRRVTDCMEEHVGGDMVWQHRYSSAGELPDKAVAVLGEDCLRDQVLKLTETEARTPCTNLVVAPLERYGRTSATEWSLQGPCSTELRHQGSETKKELQLLPTGRECGATRQKAKGAVKTFTLTAYVTEAHRQVPIDSQDWNLLGCQVQEGGCVNTKHRRDVWCRLCLVLLVAGSTATTWHQLVADDCHLEAGGAEYRTALMEFCVQCLTAGVHQHGRKTSGKALV